MSYRSIGYDVYYKIIYLKIIDQLKIFIEIFLQNKNLLYLSIRLTIT